MENSTTATFSDLLLRYLGEKDRTQSWLARQINVDPSTISKWINDNSAPTTARVIVSIANALELTNLQKQEFYKASSNMISPNSRLSLSVETRKNLRALEEYQKKIEEVQNLLVAPSAWLDSEQTNSLADFLKQSYTLLKDKKIRDAYFHYLATLYPDSFPKQKPKESNTDEKKFSLMADFFAQKDNETSLAMRLLLDRIEKLEKKNVELEDKIQKLEGRRDYGGA